jgi:hypothetical protein
MANSRCDVINHLYRYDFQLHLLGVNTLEELEYYGAQVEVGEGEDIVSIDTGFPVLCGLLDLRFRVSRLPTRKDIPTLNRMEGGAEPSPKSREADIFYNIAYFRKLTNLV